MVTAVYGSPKPESISQCCDIGDQLIRCLLKFTVNGLGGGNRQIRRNSPRDRQAEGKKVVVVDIVVHRGSRINESACRIPRTPYFSLSKV
jgi:hypothetical protein